VTQCRRPVRRSTPVRYTAAVEGESLGADNSLPLNDYVADLDQHLLRVCSLGSVSEEHFVALLSCIQAALDRWLCGLLDIRTFGSSHQLASILGEGPPDTPNPSALRLRREALAVNVTATSVALVMSLPGESGVKVGNLYRLYLDYLGMIAPVSDKLPATTDEERKAQALAGVISMRRFEPHVDEMANIDPYFKHLVHDYGAAAVGAVNLERRAKAYAATLGVGKGNAIFRAAGLYFATCLKGLSFSLPATFGESYALATLDAATRLLERVRVKSSRT